MGISRIFTLELVRANLMSERILFSRKGERHDLVEWRDPDGRAVEWISEGKRGVKVLFRWEGHQGVDASLFPANYTTHDIWYVDVAAAERTLASCLKVWKSPDVVQLWLAECQNWWPGGEWTADRWKHALQRAVLPWLAERDPWITERNFWFFQELRPFLQATSVSAGLARLGLSAAQPHAGTFVESVLCELPEGTASLSLLISAARCLRWLSAEEIVPVWDMPWARPDDFVEALRKSRPAVFQELMFAMTWDPSPDYI